MLSSAGRLTAGTVTLTVAFAAAAWSRGDLATPADVALVVVIALAGSALATRRPART